MVSIVMLPVAAGVSDHHTVLVREFVLWLAQGGVGSVDSVVAPELSTTLVVDAFTAIAFAKLSFCGGTPVTVIVWLEDSPPVGAELLTLTEAIVPKATKLWEIVAVMVVDVPSGNIVTPTPDAFQSIWAFDPKFVPVAVRVKSAEPPVTACGLMEVKVGVLPPETESEDQLLIKLNASIEPSPAMKSYPTPAVYPMNSLGQSALPTTHCTSL